jgi:endonuclease-3 related protein
MSPIKIYELLYARYGDLHWWPADTTYEIMLGAILTQNTAWRNVEKAMAQLKEAAQAADGVPLGGILPPAWVAQTDTNTLMELIRPAGFYRQKSVYLKALTAWFAGYGYSAEAVREREQKTLRDELLAVRGVGNETADAILLYAFGFVCFVADAYTGRLLKRLGISAGKGDYESVRAFFETDLPQDAYLYNNFHACIVVNGKEYCRAKPVCEGCPLEGVCAYASTSPPPGTSPAASC